MKTGKRFKNWIIVMHLFRPRLPGIAGLLSIASWLGAAAQGQAVVPDSLARVVSRGDMAALQARLSSGANPNESDDSVVKGWTPLMAAAFSGNLEAARLLLESGASFDAKTEFGKTALDIAIGAGCATCSTRTGNMQVAELLRNRSAVTQKGAAPAAATALPVPVRSQTNEAQFSSKPTIALKEIQTLAATNPSDVRKAFNKGEIVELLRLETPDALLMPQIRSAGIDFVATQGDFDELTKIGASTGLSAVVREASNRLAARKAAEAEAIAREAETLFWNEVEKKPDRQFLQSYLGRFPNGPHAKLARQRLDEMAWAKESEDQIRAVNRQPKETVLSSKQPRETIRDTKVMDNRDGGVSTGPAPTTLLIDRAVQNAKLVRKPVLVYPPLAKQARIQGTVKLTVRVGLDGTVQGAQLVSGHPLLVQAAIDAVKQWVYEPTYLNGNPVEVVTDVDINFTLMQ